MLRASVTFAPFIDRRHDLPPIPVPVPVPVPVALPVALARKQLEGRGPKGEGSSFLPPPTRDLAPPDLDLEPRVRVGGHLRDDTRHSHALRCTLLDVVRLEDAHACAARHASHAPYAPHALHASYAPHDPKAPPATSRLRLRLRLRLVAECFLRSQRRRRGGRRRGQRGRRR